MGGSGAKDFGGRIGTTYRDSQPWWPDKATPPGGAPNIVIIVLDDVGFSDLGCYGSEIATPRMDALAQQGTRYSNFHVTSMCSPTRACLLTGRNAHAVGVGIIAEWSSGFPGYSGQVSPTAATIPEILAAHAYTSYAIGKWHLTNIADYGSAGPHANWPIGKGFTRWYGFHGALTDQWNPELCQDNRPIRLEKANTDYHLSADLVDHAIGDVRDHLSSAQANPFFLYLAFGACHWPHHVPRQFIDRYRGRYDGGWDGIRADRLEKQIAMGVVPPKTTLAPLNPGVKPWSELPDGHRRLFACLQETYAGFLEHTDTEIGRLVDYLSSVGQLDNTLFILMSDNGASAEGGPTGAINLRKHMVYETESPEFGFANMDKVGSEMAYNHYPTGWAQVSNTPLKWYKKGNHGGGVRAPLIVRWPGHIAQPGAIRHQFHHVIDIAPTIYELLNVDVPQTYRGIPQIPVHGSSMAYTFTSPDAPTRKHTQMFELLGDRAIWHEGWKAVARHPKGSDFDSDAWEVYHLAEDYSEIDDLSVSRADKRKELVDLWWDEARKYGVLPLDDRDWERAAERLAMNPEDHYELLGDMARIDRLTSPDITDRSYVIKAEFAHPVEAPLEGVILAWGSHFGGFVLYVADGHIFYEYVYSESVTHAIRAPFSSAARQSVVELRFTKEGKSAGTASLAVNGKAVGDVAIPRTWPTHGTTAGLNCGRDAGAPVSFAYESPFAFTGRSLRVTIDLDIEGGGDAHTETGAYATVLKEQ